MKNGQDYMRKSTNICLTKVPESESTEENIQPKVGYFLLVYLQLCLIIFLFLFATIIA